MKLVHTVAELREEVAAAKAQGLTIGLVPTMGCLLYTSDAADDASSV